MIARDRVRDGCLCLRILHDTGDLPGLIRTAGLQRWNNSESLEEVSTYCL
jgi:hypothetical protein